MISKEDCCVTNRTGPVESKQDTGFVLYLFFLDSFSLLLSADSVFDSSKFIPFFVFFF